MSVRSSLCGRKPTSSAKRSKAMASASTGQATASTHPAPPLGATRAQVLQRNSIVTMSDPPRPRVSVTAPAAPDGNTGVVALSRNQIAASRVLQQYAQRGIIRMASTDARTHQAEPNSNSTNKRRCTGKGVNTPSVSSKRLSVGDYANNAKRHCTSQHLAACKLPRPPESGGR